VDKLWVVINKCPYCKESTEFKEAKFAKKLIALFYEEKRNNYFRD
jgi:hypothetical protein